MWFSQQKNPRKLSLINFQIFNDKLCQFLILTFATRIPHLTHVKSQAQSQEPLNKEIKKVKKYYRIKKWKKLRREKKEEYVYEATAVSTARRFGRRREVCRHKMF